MQEVHTRARTAKTRHTSSSHLLLCMCRLTLQFTPLHLYFGGFLLVKHINGSCTNYVKRAPRPQALAVKGGFKPNRALWWKCCDSNSFQVTQAFSHKEPCRRRCVWRPAQKPAVVIHMKLNKWVSLPHITHHPYQHRQPLTCEKV